MNVKEIMLTCLLLLLPSVGYTWVNQVKSGVHIIGGVAELVYCVGGGVNFKSAKLHNQLVYASAIMLGPDVFLRLASYHPKVSNNRYVQGTLRGTSFLQLAVGIGGVWVGVDAMEKSLAALCVVDGALRLYEDYARSGQKAGGAEPSKEHNTQTV